MVAWLLVNEHQSNGWVMYGSEDKCQPPSVSSGVDEAYESKTRELGSATVSK